MTLSELSERTSKARLIAWSALLILIIAAEIALTVAIPEWRNFFYNILELKAVDQFASSLILFGALMAGMGLVQGFKTWTAQTLSFILREAQTKTMFRKWVHGDRTAPNYTQAMTEAVRNSTELYLEILVEIIISAAIVAALILANLHNPLILISSIAYTLAVSVVAMLFNKPLTTQDSEWQKSEGEFRENLTNIVNGKEDFSYSSKWARLASAYKSYIMVLMNFTLFTRVKGSVSTLVPYVLLASSYFAGAITLGGFMAGVATFELIVVNATIVMMLYPKLTKARASRQIIEDFNSKI